MKCLADSIKSTEDFQKLSTLYPQYSQAWLKDALTAWQERHPERGDVIPISGTDKGSFTRFVNQNIGREFNPAVNTSTKEERALVEKYNELNSLYTPQILNNRVNYIANRFRGIVNAYSKKEENKNKSRRTCLTELGGFRGVMKAILKDIRKPGGVTSPEFFISGFRGDPKFADWSDEQIQEEAQYRAREFQIMSEHFDALSILVGRVVADRENLIIKYDQSSTPIDIEEKSLDDDKPQNNTEDGEGAKGDRFVDFRLLSLSETLSEQTNNLLGSIEQRNEDGSFVRDDLGLVKTMDDKEISYKLLEIFSGLDYTRDYVSQLEERQQLYPWLRSLVRKLRNEPDLRTMIFLDFKRAVYMYTNIRTNDTNTAYEFHYENTSNLQNALMRRAANIMRSGTPLDEKFSIYNDGGLKTMSDRKKDNTEDFSPDKVSKKLSSMFMDCYKIIIRDNVEVTPNKVGSWYEVVKYDENNNPVSPKWAMDRLLSDWDKNGNLDYIVSALRGIGMDVSKKLIKDVASRELNNSTGKVIHDLGIGGVTNIGKQEFAGNRLGVLLTSLSTLYSDASQRVANDKTDIDSFLALNSVNTSMMGLNIVIAPGLEGNVEPTTLVGENRLQTYNRPNLLHDVFDAFKKGGKYDLLQEKYESEKKRLIDEGKIDEANELVNEADEFIWDQYLSCEGYALDDRLTGWLNEIINNGIRINVEDATTFNGVEYADMSPGQKLTSSIIRMFKNNSAEVNIMSDYSSAYNFISGLARNDCGESTLTAIANGNKKSKFIPLGDVYIDPSSEVVNNIIDEVLIEADVVAAARKRLAAAKEGKWEQIGGKGGYDENAARFNLFMNFNDNGFYDEFLATDPKNRPLAAREVVKKYVVKELEKIVSEDLQYFYELGIYDNKILAKTLNFSTATDSKGVTTISKNGIDQMIDFSLNSLYSRQQIAKLLNGGMAQFKSIAEYEKRAMMNHAPRSAFYKDASWNSNGAPVIASGTQRVVYLVDSVVESQYINEVYTQMDGLVNSGKITEEQKNYFLKAYDGIKETDGQGFRTFDSWRDVMIGTGHWNNTLEDAYQSIINDTFGEKEVNELIKGLQYFKNFKPVMTGYEFVDGYENGKRIKLSVTYKYAETVLLPTNLLDATIKGSSTPVRAMSIAAERLKKQGKPVDMFLFKSGVKVNSHAEINPHDVGDKPLTAENMANNIVEKVSSSEHAIHETDYDYYGESASTPVHVMDSKIAWAAQAETMAFSDIEDEDTVEFNGETISAKSLREQFEKIKFAEALDSLRKIEDIFKDPNRLESILQEELASKSYTSPEIAFALQQIKEKGFAVPLFASSVDHETQELFSSIIRKRISSHKTKGTNIFQSTSLGVDNTNIKYQDEKIKGEDKLEIAWENKGVPGKQRIKYIECYLPITDSWLLKFADENGAIPPRRLQMLINNNQIPESILYAIGYRTPSDGVHSVFPLKIKGFTSNIEGANILLPKEAMTLAGLDFDGDKLRVHLKSFKPNWDEGLMRRDYEEHANTDENLTKVILGQKDPSDLYIKGTYEEFEAKVKNKGYKDIRYFGLEAEDYDYSKSPEENSSTQRDNARIDMIFANITSVNGTEKLLIPGGAEESVRMAKANYIIQHMNDNGVREALSANGVKSANSNAVSVYNEISKFSPNKLGVIIDSIEGNITPFSAKHSVVAHEKIVGGKQLVAVYAMQNAIVQTLQRLDLHYKPFSSTFKDGTVKQNDIFMFGKKIDKLYDTRTNTKDGKKGTLLSRIISRFLNAAVDNAKEPILGLVNQTKELAPITNFLIAAGLEEEEIHMFMSQPVLKEMGRRMKSDGKLGIKGVITDMISELVGDGERATFIDTFKFVDKFNKLTRSDFIEMLPASYSDVAFTKGEVNNLGTKQLTILYGLLHLEPAISELRDFSALMRPESHSGMLGNTIAKNTVSIDNFIRFRNKDSYRIDGINDSIFPHRVDSKMSNEVIWEDMGDMAYINLLNSIYFVNTNELLSEYFPSARPSWQEAALNIAGKYNYRAKYESTMNQLMKEMVLWQLLKSDAFSGGEAGIETNRRYYVIDFPNKVAELLKRVTLAKEDEDPAAYALKGNIFLKKLTVRKPKYTKSRPRIQFRAGGSSLGKSIDSVRRGWGQLLQSSDPEIRKIATDLYLYNMWTNGFGFGMYEFSHLAPFSLLMQVPEFMQSLRAIIGTGPLSSFPDIDSDEFRRFKEQHICNHWDDAKLVMHLKPEHIPIKYRALFGYNPNDKPTSKTMTEEEFEALEYFTLVDRIEFEGEKPRVEKQLYFRTGDKLAYGYKKAPMLGAKGRTGQMFLQLNPYIDDIFSIEPIATGEVSVYGEADEFGRYDYRAKKKPSQSLTLKLATGKVQSNIQSANPLRRLGLKAMEKFDEIDKKNDEIISKANKKKKPETVDLKASPKESDVHPDTTDSMNAESQEGANADGKTIEPAEQLTQMPKTPKLKMRLHMFVRETDENGQSEFVEREYPDTPANLKEARRQRAFVRLNKRLEKILKDKGVSVGTLYDFEERLAMAGVTDFDTARVTAEGLIEFIRLSEGKGGIYALPEEFSHLAIEMLGHNHPLVKRLLSAIKENPQAMREAYGDMYDVYAEKYGKEFANTPEGQEALAEKLALEAAGKLVAKNLLYQEEIQTSPIRRLISRIVDAIKEFFKRFSKSDIKDAIMDADEIASKMARELLSGRLLDDMSIENIGSSGKFLSVQKDLSDRDDILSKLLKNAVKRKEVFESRLRYAKDSKRGDMIALAEKEIKSLEKSISDYTVEEGVNKCLSDSLAMLGEVEKLFDDVSSPSNRQEYGFNTICRYLRIYKDAVYSVSKSLKDVEDAIRDSEFPNSEVVNENYKNAVGVVGSFNTKYQRVAMEYFEELLSDIYGPHGKTWGVGKNKGKIISIHDMARRADHDISLASRYFNSLADCPDLVLKAFSETTRNAKRNARRKANMARAEIDAAVAELARETGSRDQSFMFEYLTKPQMIAREKAIFRKKYKRAPSDDEIHLDEPWASETDMTRKHKSGLYISEKAAKRLSPAQRKFYDTIMRIKKEIDSYLPESEVSDRKIVMITKSRMDRVMASDDIKSGAQTLWDGVRNSVLDTSDDIDYENEQVRVDFGDNRIDMLPIHYVRKAKHLTFDDMSDDVASTVLAYAGMGYEYNELSAIADWLEVSKDMAAQRNVVMKSGQKVQRENIGGDESDYVYSEPYTVKQAKTKMQEALNDFFFMHLYGGLQRDEGTIGNTRIDKRKAANMLNHIASLSQMAINLQQRISNISTGMSMIVIESAGKGAFKAKDVLWGSKIWMKYAPDRLLGVGNLNNDNKLALWIEHHDITNDDGRELRDRGYAKSRFKRVANENVLYSGMLAGEDFLASVTSLAIARNFKVLNTETNKVETLWDAYDVAYVDPVNKTGAYLKLKDNYTKLDGTPITKEDEDRFAKRVAGVNFELQGIYNLDDKSAVQQYALGALIIMYRKWIAPALKRRYGGVDYNILKDEDTEGYYRTAVRLLGDAYKRIKTDGEDVIGSVKGAWADMNEYEKGNCKKAMREMAIILGCIVAIAGLSRWTPGDDDDDKPKMVAWLDHQFLYQLLRLRNEIGSQAPTPLLVDEASKLLKSPMAATRPLAAGLDAFQLLVPSNYFTEVRSGRYKGHTKAYKYFHDLPIISMGRNFRNFQDPSSLIKFYNSKSF